MALQEFEKQYYKLNPAQCFADESKTLHIAFIVYKTAIEREKEKKAIPIYQEIKNRLAVEINILKPIIEKQITEMAKTENTIKTEELIQMQELSDIDEFLLDTLYKRTNENKELVLRIVDKYNWLKNIKQYVENPIEIIYNGKITEPNYLKNNPTLEEIYNILKTRIGKNIDV